MTTTAKFTARRLRFIALLAAFVFFAGQTLVLQHVHADDLPGSSCVVCLQSDHSPVSQSLPLSAAPYESETWQPVTQALFRPKDICVCHPTRAPPAT